MRPFDPQLLRAAPAARRPVAALAAVGVLQGIATVATAFALTALIVAVVVGLPVGRPAAWLLAVFTVRAALAWLGERTAAWAGVRVSSSVREQLLASWLSADSGRTPRPGPGRDPGGAGSGQRRALRRALPALPGHRGGGATAGDPHARSGRLAQRRDRAAHGPPAPRLRRPHRGQHPRVDRAPLARTVPAVGPLPGRHARPAHPRVLRPGGAPDRDDRRGQPAPPPSHARDAAAGLPQLCRPRAARDALGGDGRGHRRHPACARLDGARHRPGRDPAGPRGLLAHQAGRSRVPLRGRRGRRARRDLLRAGPQLRPGRGRRSHARIPRRRR